MFVLPRIWIRTNALFYQNFMDFIAMRYESFSCFHLHHAVTSWIESVFHVTWNAFHSLWTADFIIMWLFQCGTKRIRFVIMNNILPRRVKMHQKYDLKGSTFKRFVFLVNLQNPFVSGLLANSKYILFLIIFHNQGGGGGSNHPTPLDVSHFMKKIYNEHFLFVSKTSLSHCSREIFSFLPIDFYSFIYELPTIIQWILLYIYEFLRVALDLCCLPIAILLSLLVISTCVILFFLFTPKLHPIHILF